jgi:hypothetical protein
VAALAAAAASGAVVLTGGLSSALTTASSFADPTHQEAGNADSLIRTNLVPEAHAAPAPSPPGRQAVPAAGIWQIQVGAFRSPAAAQSQLRAAESLVPELASLAEAPLAYGDMTRARFRGIANEAEARRLCGRVSEAGGRCFVVAPGG